MRHRVWTAGLTAILSGLTLSACVGMTREPFALQDRMSAAPLGFVPGGEQPIRFYVDGEDRLAFFQQRVAAGLAVGPDGHFDLLALSGGGANGAFTAGVMKGWTESGRRPDFEVVTGVSTGALAAPFVFLGPEWDDALAEAYLGGGAQGLLRSQGVGALFGSGVFQAAPLRRLVETHVTPELLAAVAAEHRKGRTLLVATTDLDAQRGVSWDMGVIAERGGPDALKLFRDVLVASASIPVAFPPVLIDSWSGQTRFQEMHVDGGVTTPFLALPETMWTFRAQGGNLTGARLHVIVNGRLAPSFAVTTDSLASVAGRSVDALLRGGLVQALAGNRVFAQRNNLLFEYAAIPDAVEADPLTFEATAMRKVYEVGREGARTGTIWQ